MDKCAFSGNAIANRTHVLQACEMYKEERDRLGEKVIEIDEFEHADVWQTRRYLEDNCHNSKEIVTTDGKRSSTKGEEDYI